MIFVVQWCLGQDGSGEGEKEKHLCAGLARSTYIEAELEGIKWIMMIIAC